MLDFLKRKKGALPPKDDNTTNPERSLFDKLKQGLTRTRKSLGGMFQLFAGKKEIDAEILEELERILLSADVGLEVTQAVVKELKLRVERKTLEDVTALSVALKELLEARLAPYQVPLKMGFEKPYVILMVGVNGTGKTTTIGKLANALKAEGKSVLLAAGDTFRAAAIEQLQVWGERNQIPVIAQHSGADSASVIFDALQAAISRNVDVLIADTAGRLHTQDTLMEELKKVLRVMKKLDPNAPHEVILVLDAGIGQNAITQARKFYEAVGVTSIILTKLDGTAKGGVIFNIVNALKLPIRFIGLGEGLDDLRPFEAKSFVEALFTQPTE